MAPNTVPGVGPVAKRKPGEHSGCVAKGNSLICADLKVGNEGTLCGMTVFDETLKETTEGHVGHVTLLR